MTMPTHLRAFGMTMPAHLRASGMTMPAHLRASGMTMPAYRRLRYDDACALKCSGMVGKGVNSSCKRNGGKSSEENVHRKILFEFLRRTCRVWYYYWIIAQRAADACVLTPSERVKRCEAL